MITTIQSNGVHIKAENAAEALALRYLRSNNDLLLRVDTSLLDMPQPAMRDDSQRPPPVPVPCPLGVSGE